MKPCQGCGGPKEPGQARRYCNACRERLRPHSGGLTLPVLCERCGEPKPKGHGRKLCDDCRELGQWRKTRRDSARRKMNRQPCWGCGGPADSSRSRYCESCRAVRATKPCRQCGQPKPRRDGRLICENCVPRHARKPCGICGGPKEPGIGRRSCDACRDDVGARHTRHRQSQRITHVLRAEREGRTVEFQSDAIGAWEAGARRGDRMSIEPFAVWIKAILHTTKMQITELGKIFGHDESYVRRHADCTYKNVGLKVADRSLCDYGQSVHVDGRWLQDKLIAEAQDEPGNGWRLLHYMDFAEKVAHMADEDIEFLWDLWPAQGPR